MWKLIWKPNGSLSAPINAGEEFSVTTGADLPTPGSPTTRIDCADDSRSISWVTARSIWMTLSVSAVAGLKAFHPEGGLGGDRKVGETGGGSRMPVLAWTVDFLGGLNPETALRFMRLDTRDCLSCHTTTPTLGGVNPQVNRSKPMFSGLSGSINPPQATWIYVDRLKKLTTMKVVLKGIATAEDATLAVEHGADGVIVSNHGGRVETGRGTLDILPEVVDAVGGWIPVLVDGGFRRGSDVYKALAIGARAVGIGRPYLYGLASFGQEGVEARARHPARGADSHAAPVRHSGDRANHAGVGAQERVAVLTCHPARVRGLTPRDAKPDLASDAFCAIPFRARRHVPAPERLTPRTAPVKGAIASHCL
jgi:hypothetical protein